MIKLVPRAVVFASVALVLAPAAAPAVNRTGARRAAMYESARICPHHFLGKCIHRDWGVVRGTGGGTWKCEARGWENLLFENDDGSAATWFYGECFRVRARGGIDRRRWIDPRFGCA
jgi:hypothetical protein